MGKDGRKYELRTGIGRPSRQNMHLDHAGQVGELRGIGRAGSARRRGVDAQRCHHLASGLPAARPPPTLRRGQWLVNAPPSANGRRCPAQNWPAAGGRGQMGVERSCRTSGLLSGLPTGGGWLVQHRLATRRHPGAVPLSIGGPWCCEIGRGWAAASSGGLQRQAAAGGGRCPAGSHHYRTY